MASCLARCTSNVSVYQVGSDTFGKMTSIRVGSGPGIATE